MAVLEQTSSNMTRRERELRRELVELRQQMADLSNTVSDIGRGIYVDASADARDLVKGLALQTKRAQPFAKKKQREATMLARAYPFTLASALAGMGLLAAAVLAYNYENED